MTRVETPSGAAERGAALSGSARVATPIGAVQRPEPRSAEDLSADPDLARWQADRWAPHPLEPEEGERFEHARGDGSFHDRTLASAEAESAGEADIEPADEAD